MYSPKIVVCHHRKDKLRDFLLQHGRYGFQRGSFFAKGDKNSRKIIYAIPSFFLVYLIFLFLSVLFTKSLLLSLPLIIYLVSLVIFFDLQILKRRGLLFSLCSTLILLLLHFTYAGFFIKAYTYKSFKL